MLASEREIYILDQLKNKRAVTFKEVAEELRVSVATVRRDIELLEKKGLLVRVRSGATRTGLENAMNEPQPLITSAKAKLNVLAKKEIARRAAAYVSDGECVFLDGGTTVAQMAEFIENKNIKIVTPNVLVMPGYRQTVAEFYFLGGYYRSLHASTVGPYAERMIKMFHFDHAFFGCSGVELTQNAIYDDDIDTISIKDIARTMADHCFLLADSSKLNITSYCRMSDINDYECIITDSAKQLPSYPDNFIVCNI